MNITYRFFDTNSESDIYQWLDLHSICFQYDISQNLWDIIHLKNPFYNKTKPLILIAELDKKIVGSVSLIPSPIQEHRNNTVILYNSLLICKAMVHPDYRKKGIFNHLLKNSMDVATYEGYDTLLTVSDNPYSYKSFVRIGFHDVAAMRWSKVYLSIDTASSHYFDTLKLPRIVKKIFVSLISFFYSQLISLGEHSYQLKYGDITEFVEEITNFFISNQSHEGIFGIRTNPFIQWRFCRNDEYFKCFTLWDSEIMIGYLIIQYKEGEKNAFIVDMCLSNDKTSLISILTKESQEYLKKNKFQRLSVYMMEKDSNLSKFFSFRNGFFIQSSEPGKLNKSRFLMYALNKNLVKTFFSDKNNWNLQSVDTCLFI